MVSKSRFSLQSLIDFGGRYIYHDSHKDTEYNRICSEQMDITMQSFLIKMGTIFISFLFAVVGPVHAYVFYGIKSTTTEVHIPYCEPKSLMEFELNFLLQSTIAGHGIFMYILMEMLFSLFENVVTIAPRLISHELVNVIQLAEDRALSVADVYLNMARIAKLSQDTDK